MLLSPLKWPSLLIFPYIFSPLKNLIHNPKLHRLLRVHKVITHHELLNLLQTPLLRQMTLINLIQPLPHPQNLLRMIRNIARLARIPAARLMDHDPRMGQNIPLSSFPSTEQQTPHGRSLAHAYSADRAADVVHGVVDGEAGAHAAAGRVDVQRDGLLRVVGFEEEQLGDDHGGHGFFDFAVEADDALLE